jgi:hypothetical protein
MAISKCGLVGGVTFYVDGTAAADGDGSEGAPWNSVDEAIENITTYQKNMNTYVYLNIKGTGNVPYPVTESISYLSDFTMRSYGDWDASPVEPESIRPRLVFASGVSEHFNHLDNFGTNNIELIAGNIGAIESFEMRYSYIGMTDTDVNANLKLVNTRLTSKTMFKPNVNFTGTSTASTIELTKGSVLIVLDAWNLNGLLPSSTVESIFYNGGVLISERISNYATAKEPSINEYAIGYYNPASLKINIPDDQHKNIPNQVLIWDNGGSGAPSASFREIDSCESIGCSTAPEIEYWSFERNVGDTYLVFGGLLRIKTPTMKKLYILSQSAFVVKSASVDVPDLVPLRFRPKNTASVGGYTGISWDNRDQWINIDPNGNVAYHIVKLDDHGNNGMFVRRWDNQFNYDTQIQFKEIEPLNDL